MNQSFVREGAGTTNPRIGTYRRPEPAARTLSLWLAIAVAAALVALAGVL